MITLNQAERLRKKYKDREMGLRRYKAIWNKLTKENEKLENVNISEYYIERMYKDKLLDQKPFLELLKAPQIRISSTRDFFELVDRYKEINEKISRDINRWKSEGKFPTAYEYLSQMKQEDLWRNFLKVLKLTNTEISPLEIEEYIYEIHPNAVEVLERIYRYCKDIVEEENGKDLFKINKYRYDSTLEDEEIGKIVDVSKRLKDVFREKYGIELNSADVLRKIISELYYHSEKEKLKTIENIPEIFEDEKIRERIKAGEELGETRDLIYMYFRNPEFFEALKEGKIDAEVLFDSPPEEISDNPSFYGRIRQGRTRNLVDLAAYGREGRDSYHDSEYLRYFLPDGRDGKDFSEIEKKVKAIEKFPFLRKKLCSLSEMLKKWREEGKRYEGVNLRLGAYAKWDGDVNLKEAYNHKIEGDAIGFQIALNQGLKAPSHFGKKIKEFVDELYSISKKAEENPGIFYALNHWEELSEPEREYLEKELRIGTDELKRVEEWIMNTPKGVYSEAPPLHNGNRGEDVAANNPRSYYMLDKVFYNYNGDKIGVIEYLVGDGSEDEEMRIRVYNFNGNGEFAVEIYKDGKGRFLNRKEVEEMNGQLENYTLPTLFLKDYFERFTEQKIGA